MLSINTDLQNILLRSTLNKSTLDLNDAVSRMTTGYKVNHAKDNAAGYSIITDLSTRISSLLQVQQNTEDGIALLSTAEGGLQEIQTQLERLRELTMQASTGTYDATTRAKMQTEADSIIKEINRLRKTVEYDGRSLFYSTEVEPLMERINNILGETNIASPASLQVANSNQTPLALTATISDTVEIQAGETKDIVIDGVNYSVRNNGSAASNFEYSKDISSGILTITCNEMEITGQNNVSHKIVLNGDANRLGTGDYDDIIMTNSGNAAVINSGAGDDRITMKVPTRVIDLSGDDTYCIENAQSAAYSIRDIAGNNNIKRILTTRSTIII